MWDPMIKNIYKNFINKKVYIKLIPKIKKFVIHGILIRVSKPNKDGVYSLILGYNNEYTHVICSDIIDKIWYDNSLNNYFNFKKIELHLIKQLNYDVTNYEIKNYLKYDFYNL